MTGMSCCLMAIPLSYFLRRAALEQIVWQQHTAASYKEHRLIGFTHASNGGFVVVKQTLKVSAIAGI